MNADVRKGLGYLVVAVLAVLVTVLVGAITSADGIEHTAVGQIVYLLIAAIGGLTMVVGVLLGLFRIARGLLRNDA